MKKLFIAVVFLLLVSTGIFLGNDLKNSDKTAVAALAVGAYVSPTGNDANTCAQSAPCKTFNRAYRVAAPGTSVEVAGGTYPAQTIQVDSSKTSTSDVTFVPASGATVTVGCGTIGTVGNGTINGASCIDVYGSHITFDGGASKAFKTQTYTVNGFSYQGRIDTERGSDDVTFKNMDIGAFTAAASHMSVVSNDLGPSVDPLNNLVVEEAVGIQITDNLIHDYVIVNGGHFECMYWDGVTNPTLAYNEFRSCAVYGVHSKEGNTFSSKGAVVDHNVFWNPRALTTQADVQLTTEILPCSNSTVTNNVFTDGLINECTPTVKSNNTFRSQSDPAPASPIRDNPPVVTTTGSTTTAVTTTTAPTTTTVPPTTTTSAPTVNDLLQDGLVHLKASSPYKTWAKQNPGESSAINNWQPGQTLPTPATEFGKFYLDYRQALTQ